MQIKLGAVLSALVLLSVSTPAFSETYAEMSKKYPNGWYINGIFHWPDTYMRTAATTPPKNPQVGDRLNLNGLRMQWSGKAWLMDPAGQVVSTIAPNVDGPPFGDEGPGKQPANNPPPAIDNVAYFKGQAQAPMPAYGTDFEKNVLLAAVSPKADMTAVKATLKNAGATLEKEHDLSFFHLLRIKTGAGKMPTVYATLAKDKTFVGLQPNWYSTWSGTAPKPPAPPPPPVVNDPLFPNQWYLFDMKWPEALKVPSATGYIAMLDSGCASNTDLKGRVSAGYSTVTGSSESTDGAPGGGHGTKLASIAAAQTNNSTLIAAINPMAYIFPIKVGDSFTDDEHLVFGLFDLLRSGVKVAVIGVSPSSRSWSLLSHPLVYAMLGLYKNQGGLAFAPAGNLGVPLGAASDPALLLVGAEDRNGVRASYSNYGNAVWFSAPGSALFAVDNAGSRSSLSGTSASCALFAAAASFIWGCNPKMSRDEILQVLQTYSSTKGRRGALGYGNVDMQAAANAVGSKR